MPVTLNRPYANQPAGTNITLPASTEAALIAQGLAVNLPSGAATPGSMTNNQTRGRAAFAVGASSVVITNPLVNVSSKINAQFSSAGADATLTSFSAVPSSGSMVFTGNANATAVTQFDWELVNVANSLSTIS